jgi:hypothetical protein
MKTKILSTFCLASVVMLAVSFTVREKEEALKPSVDYYLLQDRSFTSFISTLQKMEALVYIPKSKVTDTRRLGISLVPDDKAVALNKQFAGSIKNWVPLVPSDKAGEEVTLNFQKIKILTFVRQEKVTTKLIDVMQMKSNPDTLDIEELTVKIDASRPEELQLKWEGTKTWQSYVPVTVR